MAKFIVTGITEQMRLLKRLGADVADDAVTALEAAGQHFENKIKIELSDRSGARTGKIYTTGRKGARYATHRASAPGEPPAKLSGLLMGSITHMAERIGKAGARGEVGTNMEYAEPLERGNIHMEPRPFIFPVIVREAIPAQKVIARSLRKSLMRYRKK